MSEYTGELRVGEKVLPIIAGSIVIEQNITIDPPSLKLQKEVDIYRQESPNEWVHTKTTGSLLTRVRESEQGRREEKAHE